MVVYGMIKFILEISLSSGPGGKIRTQNVKLALGKLFFFFEDVKNGAGIMMGK